MVLPGPTRPRSRTSVISRFDYSMRHFNETSSGERAEAMSVDLSMSSCASSLAPMAALVVRGVSKRFGAVQALDDVSLELARGEIHALVGENGSGKSTLVKIVAGTIVADSGSVDIAGEALQHPTPSRSRRLGTHTVYQDGSMIDELSIAQNMYIGSGPGDRPRYAEIERWTQAILSDQGSSVTHPAMRVAAVAPGDQQLIEIVRAVHG